MCTDNNKQKVTPVSSSSANSFYAGVLEIGYPLEFVIQWRCTAAAYCHTVVAQTPSEAPLHKTSLSPN